VLELPNIKSRDTPAQLLEHLNKIEKNNEFEINELVIADVV
jgi:hypothetical protein